MAVDGLRTETGLSGISLELRNAKILGLGGLDGMGQRELFMTMFGLVEPVAGTISIRGQPVRMKAPADAIHLDIGISMVPEDRKTEGLFLELDGRRNISLPSLDRFVRYGLVSYAKEQAEVERILDVVQVARRAFWSAARDFSGGNQQKMIIAKWLLVGSRVLLLYDPTRGVDVGTKAEIYRLVRAFADAGGAVLFYSTDIPELVNLCDEVAVIYRGRIAQVLQGEAISERSIMTAAVGAPSRMKEDDDSRAH
jgi:ribose transport system ATP-binding protein